jgi:uncharacterized protein (TIGR00266 family)
MSEIWKVGMPQRNAPPVSSAPRAGRFGRRLSPLNSETPGAFTLSNAAQPEPERHIAHPAIPNDIDFAIAGSDMQYVEIELDPGEAIVADNGSMIWKDTAIEFAALLGDGSEQGGLWSKVASAGKNLLAGENMFISEFRHAGSSGKARVAVGGAVPGHIIPIRLEAMGGTLICQRDAFLAAAKGVSISIAFQRKIMTGLFGGEGFIMQRLTGQGWAFLHVGGTLIERQLAAGEEIQVDTGCVAAYEPSIDFDIAAAGSFGTGLVGGEGFFLATMRGPGKVWIQTLPFSRLAAETVAAAPSAAASSRRHSNEVDVIGGIQSLTKMF